jgi:hypothetical protein
MLKRFQRQAVRDQVGYRDFSIGNIVQGIDAMPVATAIGSDDTLFPVMQGIQALKNDQASSWRKGFYGFPIGIL